MSNNWKLRTIASRFNDPLRIINLLYPVGFPGTGPVQTCALEARRNCVESRESE